MTHEARSADDIERDIARERSQMSSTINDLQKKFSVDAIVDDLGHMVRDLSDDFGRTISRTVARNPAAMVVVGAGLAWLVLGASRNPSNSTSARRSDRSADSRRRFGQRDSASLPTDRSDGHGAWFGDGHRQGHNGARKHGTPNGATGMVERAKDAVGDASGSVGDAASDLSDWLSDGLDDLSEQARTRVIAARRAAYDARDASEAAMHRGAGATADFFRDQPLVVGALAVAFGAAIGSMLPHSRLEDDTMGESSDQLFEDAQAVFREEHGKAMAALKGVAGDVKDEIDAIGSDLKSEAANALPDDKSMGEVVADRASGATRRVYESAKETFDEKGSSSTRS